MVNVRSRGNARERNRPGKRRKTFSLLAGRISRRFGAHLAP
jgi:hypothetical protein